MNQGTVPQQTSSLPTLILNFLAARPMRDKLVLFIMLEVCRNFVALWFKKKSEGSKAALLQQEDTMGRLSSSWAKGAHAFFRHFCHFHSYSDHAQSSAKQNVELKSPVSGKSSFPLLVVQYQTGNRNKFEAGWTVLRNRAQPQRPPHGLGQLTSSVCISQNGLWYCLFIGFCRTCGLVASREQQLSSLQDEAQCSHLSCAREGASQSEWQPSILCPQITSLVPSEAYFYFWQIIFSKVTLNYVYFPQCVNKETRQSNQEAM